MQGKSFTADVAPKEPTTTTTTDSVSSDATMAEEGAPALLHCPMDDTQACQLRRSAEAEKKEGRKEGRKAREPLAYSYSSCSPSLPLFSGSFPREAIGRHSFGANGSPEEPNGEPPGELISAEGEAGGRSGGLTKPVTGSFTRAICAGPTEAPLRLGDSLTIEDSHGACWGVVVSNVKPLEVRRLLHRTSQTAEKMPATWERWLHRESARLWIPFLTHSLFGWCVLFVGVIWLTQAGLHPHSLNRVGSVLDDYPGIHPGVPLNLGMSSIGMNGLLYCRALAEGQPIASRRVALGLKWYRVALQSIMLPSYVFFHYIARSVLLGHPWFSQCSLFQAMVYCAWSCVELWQWLAKDVAASLAQAQVAIVILMFNYITIMVGCIMDPMYGQFVIYEGLFIFLNLCISLCHCLHVRSVWLYWQSDWWFPSRFEQAPLLARLYNRLARNAAMQRSVWQADEGDVPKEVLWFVEAMTLSEHDLEQQGYKLKEASNGREALPAHERMCLTFNGGWFRHQSYEGECIGTREAGDEEHLLLGITELTLTAYLAFCGFIFRSQPKHSASHNSGLPAIRCLMRAHGETEEAPAWLLEDFPTLCKKEYFTGYEICIAIKKLQEALQQITAPSVLEGLAVQGVHGTGEAHHFLSHWQGETLEETLKAMRLRVPNANRSFVDYVSVRQCLKGDFSPATVYSVLRSIGSTVLVYAPNMYGSSLDRLWVTYEVICSVDQSMRRQSVSSRLSTMSSLPSTRHAKKFGFIIQDIMHSSTWNFVGQLRQIRSLMGVKMRIEEAKARDEKDKEMVLAFAAEHVGIEEANTRGGKALQEHVAILVSLLGRNMLLWGLRLVLLAMATVNYYANDC